MTLSAKVRKCIKKVVKPKKRADALVARLESFTGTDCEACDDDELWIDVPVSERRAICGPNGLNCPGWGGDPEG